MESIVYGRINSVCGERVVVFRDNAVHKPGKGGACLLREADLPRVKLSGRKLELSDEGATDER